LVEQELHLEQKILNYHLLDSKKIGFVFQTFNLLASLTALENVEMPMILNGVLSQAERRQRAKELLDIVGMSKRLDHIPSQLSGGEQQRVTIARAIANKPEILLLDEPTGDLDTVNTHIVMKLLTELNQQQKITLIMVTHDVALKNFADRIIWMRDGKIQRIEIVDPDKKIESIKRNEDELIQMRRHKKKNANKPPSTEFRIPTDYTTNPKFSKRDPSIPIPEIPSLPKNNDQEESGEEVDSDEEIKKKSKKKQTSSSKKSKKQDDESD